MGEAAFNQEQVSRAVSWIRKRPERFLELTAQRFALFWFPRMVRTPQTVLIRCEAIAGIVGFLLLLRTDNPAKWIVGGVWLGYPLIYYFVEASPHGIVTHRLEFCTWVPLRLRAFWRAKERRPINSIRRDPLGADRPAAAETTSRLRPTPQNKFPSLSANCFIFRLGTVKPSQSNAIEKLPIPRMSKILPLTVRAIFRDRVTKNYGNCEGEVITSAGGECNRNYSAT